MLFHFNKKALNIVQEIREHFKFQYCYYKVSTTLCNIIYDFREHRFSKISANSTYSLMKLFGIILNTKKGISKMIN